MLVHLKCTQQCLVWCLCVSSPCGHFKTNTRNFYTFKMFRKKIKRKLIEQKNMAKFKSCT